MLLKRIPLLLVVVLLLAGCDASQPTEPVQEDAAATEATAEQREFTREELAQYNGKDGQPAYVAVDGVVYDLSDSGAWADGEHNGFEAGNDLTDNLANDAPHDEVRLQGFPVVGTLVD